MVAAEKKRSKDTAYVPRMQIELTIGELIILLVGRLLK